jgi:hypothetical protein
VSNDIWTVQFSGPFSLRRSFYCLDSLVDYVTKDKQPNLSGFQVDFLFVKGVSSKMELSLDELTIINNFKDNVLNNLNLKREEKYTETLCR